MAYSQKRRISTVSHGDKVGRTIGFPTLNLDPTTIEHSVARGVWAAEVQIREEMYSGALYIGPRTVQNETKEVLEIYVLNFGQEIYGEKVTFVLKKYIRPMIHFTSLQDLKTQLQSDVLGVREYFKHE